MIDFYAAVSYLSECDNGHEFKWGYAQGARISHIIEKSCACDANLLRIIRERVKLDE